MVLCRFPVGPVQGKEVKERMSQLRFEMKQKRLWIMLRISLFPEG